MTQPVVPCAAGTRILHMRKIVEERHGAAFLQKALAELPEPLREEYLGASAVSWVPTATEYAVHDAIARALGQEPLAFHEKLLREAMERSFKTLWRILLSFTSDEALIARTPLIYSRTRNVGEMQARLVSPGRAELNLRGYPGIAVRDVRSLSAGLETVLTLTGREGAQVAGTLNGEGAVFQVTWSA
ncbi:MAG: hypothetical protein AB2A00_38855 [Myxococcota bacterium]